MAEFLFKGKPLINEATFGTCCDPGEPCSMTFSFQCYGPTPGETAAKRLIVLDENHLQLRGGNDTARIYIDPLLGNRELDKARRAVGEAIDQELDEQRKKLERDHAAAILRERGESHAAGVAAGIKQERHRRRAAGKK
jgi:hypothetical protein